MKFRNFVLTPDGGIVMLAEKFHVYEYTRIESTGGGVGGFSSTRMTRYRVYECGNLMMSKVEKDGTISWLHVLPKYQKETINMGSSPGFGGGIYFSTFYDPGFNWPFYAGFGLLPATNSATIIFNDRKKNENVLQLGQKVKPVFSYRKSQCYGVKLDLVTGKYTRSILFDNDDVPTAMPRLGSALGKDLYIIGKEDRLFGKQRLLLPK